MAENENNRRMAEEMAMHQRRIQQLEAEIHGLRSTPRPAAEDTSHLQRDVNNLIREVEALRTRFVKPLIDPLGFARRWALIGGRRYDN